LLSLSLCLSLPSLKLSTTCYLNICGLCLCGNVSCTSGTLYVSNHLALIYLSHSLTLYPSPGGMQQKAQLQGEGGGGGSLIQRVMGTG
jgi:hypothetical protein